VQDAQVNVLVTFQTTGIKLKLLNSLFRGRHCVVNKEMVENTGLEEVCEMGQTTEELVRAIEQCAEKPFTEAELAKRREILDASFSNLNSAGKILSLMQENRLYT
jgi:hypothetical protein